MPDKRKKDCDSCSNKKVQNKFTTEEWQKGDGEIRLCKKCTIDTANAQNTILKQFMEQSAETQKQIADALSNQTSDANDSYTKLLYQSKAIGEFNGKYPRTQDAFYLWSYKIKEFQTNHSGLGCSEELLFHKVIGSLDTSARSAWDQYRYRAYQKYLQDDPTLVDDPKTSQSFSKGNDTVSELIKFTIKRVMIRPDIYHFQERFAQIRYLENERPAEALSRINTHLFQYESLRKQLDPHLTFKLRKLKAHEKVDIIKRVFISTNVGIGHLNKKIRHKISTKWIELETENIFPEHKEEDYEKMLEQLTKYINDELAEKVLPSLAEDFAEDGKGWITHPAHTSLFEIEIQVPESTNHVDDDSNKRKRTGPEALEPPTKRYKHSQSQSDNEYQRERERESNHRRKRISDSQHSESRDQREKSGAFRREQESKRVQRAERVERESEKTDRGDKKSFYTNHTDYIRGNNGKCRRGQQCSWWQKGDCHFIHNPEEMKCWACGVIGHARYQCPQSQNQQPTPQRYSLKNPNHAEIKPHGSETQNNSNDFITQKYVDQRLQGISQQIKELSQKTPKRMALIQPTRSNNIPSVSTKEKHRLTTILGKLGVFE